MVVFKFVQSFYFCFVFLKVYTGTGTYVFSVATGWKLISLCHLDAAAGLKSRSQTLKVQ